ncbi:hypothetical protein [Flagellimonas lutaonensis]|uniref:hypothetical protein n=1 Tax=Flagellimonas lutaonensis TaxID=516051 RepID=UPI0005F778C1|nr:hypothetical protein [Allomuricauda lutaonensis]
MPHHVAIYNKEGKVIKHNLFYVENGMARGDFAIDSTLADTEYTLLAWTNYMRNFKNLEPFRQNITVLKDDITHEDDSNGGISITSYPEGGHLISGAYNHIGILVKDDVGQEVSVDNITLVDETGKLIRSNITTNALGMGKTGLMIENGKRYFLKLQRPDGSMVTIALPEAVKNQIGLSIDNNGQDQILVKLVASKATFNAKDDKSYSIAIYRDEFIHFENAEINPDEPVISLRREQLPFGILTAVLFDQEQKPIAYRMFFNHRHNETRLTDLKIDHCLTAFGDSIQIDLILPKAIQNEINVSISALPGQSLSYTPDNSIITSFLLQPYIKTYFEDRYFFENQDRKKRFELDNRLLIEGWGRYDWDSKKLQKAKMDFEMENGISFQGKVIDADLNEENQVYFTTDFSAAMQFEELGNDKSFAGNMVLFEGDSLGITLIGKKGKLRKPEVEVQLSENVKAIDDTKNWLTWKVLNRQEDVGTEEIIDQSLNIGERIIVLEEVTVVDKSVNTNKTDMFIPKSSLLPIS